MSEQEDWYDGLEPGVREVVRLLRDNGFNTRCSCEHNMEIQLDVQHADDGERLATLLCEAGHSGFVIRVHIEVPPDGYWQRSMAVKLQSWPFGGACFDPEPLPALPVPGAKPREEEPCHD